MKEQKLVMYMHAGSGNHGCEAIVNSVCHMGKKTKSIPLVRFVKLSESADLRSIKLPMCCIMLTDF